MGLDETAAAYGPAIEQIAASMGKDVTTSAVSPDDVESALLDDGVAAVVSVDATTVTATVAESLDPSLQAVLTSLAQQIALSQAVTDLGGDPGAVAQQLTEATVATVPLDPPDAVDPGKIVAAYLVGILLYVALMTCGQMIAQGVVEEKSSRVIEILLATVRPWQMMAGKVAGIGAIGLLQVILVVGASVGTALGLGLLDGSGLDLGGVAASTVAWFFVGFITYAVTMAGLGALVSRQEEVGSVLTPMMMLIIVPYIVGVTIAPWDPDNPLVVWLSRVPFCAPLVMPIRSAVGAVGQAEELLVLAVNIAIIPVLVWLSGRVYSNAVLRTGSRVKLMTALRGSAN